MSTSKIEWTDVVWNPVRGCSKVSAGCALCYAERQAARFVRDPFAEYGKPQPFDGFVLRAAGGYRWTGRVELVPSALDKPLRWRKPRRVFVNSMSDLFHEALPDEAVDRVFAVMALAPHHTFQVLTKRPARMRAYMQMDLSARAGGWCRHDMVRNRASDIAHLRGKLETLAPDVDLNSWPLPNVWLGVSVEDQASADARIPILLDTPAAVRFVSYEPALGNVDFRAWMSNNPVHEAGEQRAGDIRGRSERRTGDRQPGVHLATGREARQQMDWRHAHDSMPSSQDRVADECGLSPDQVDGGLAACLRDGSPPRLDSLPRADTGRAHDQPQERREGRQPALQPRTGDDLGAGAAHDRRSEEGPRAEPVGNEESQREVDDGSGGRDPQAAGRRRDERFGCGVARRGASNGGQHLHGRSTISWLICGGGSGLGARPCNIEWIRSARDQCKAVGVPVFVKQLGAAAFGCDGMHEGQMRAVSGRSFNGFRRGVPKLRHAKGGDQSEWPEDLRVREFPAGASK